MFLRNFCKFSIISNSSGGNLTEIFGIKLACELPALLFFGINYL